MTYSANDISPSSGLPIEFFKFEGLLRDYRYCDQSKPETLAGEVYEPMTIFRSNVELGSIIDSQKSMSISIPSDSDLAKDFGGIVTPTQLAFTLYRAYRGDDLNTQFKRRYGGRAVTYGYDGRLFQIEFNNTIATDLNRESRQVYYQSICNHRLYDARCKADKNANTFISTVVNFSDNAVEVADDSTGNGDLLAGTLVNVRTGEERLILNNLANIIDIGYPFVDIVAGDQVQLVRGCNNGTNDCITKFDNYVNYGGYLFMPSVNPFENEF